MKRKIAVLTAALGLAIAIPVAAYPTDNANGGTMDSQAGTVNNQTGSRQIEKVKMDQLPQSIQSTINQHLAGGNVKHIERVSENGQTFYDVSLKNANGEKQQFRVDSNGQYLGPQTSNENMSNGQNNTTSQDQNSGGLRPKQDEH